MAESVPLEPEDDKKSKGKPRRVNHVKMVVLNDLQEKTIDSQVAVNIRNDAETDSDNSTS
jgi:hypothetical protein